MGIKINLPPEPMPPGTRVVLQADGRWRPAQEGEAHHAVVSSAHIDTSGLGEPVEVGEELMFKPVTLLKRVTVRSLDQMTDPRPDHVV